MLHSPSTKQRPTSTQNKLEQMRRLRGKLLTVLAHGCNDEHKICSDSCPRRELRADPTLHLSSPLQFGLPHAAPLATHTSRPSPQAVDRCTYTYGMPRSWAPKHASPAAPALDRFLAPDLRPCRRRLSHHGHQSSPLSAYTSPPRPGARNAHLLSGQYQPPWTRSARGHRVTR